MRGVCAGAAGGVPAASAQATSNEASVPRREAIVLAQAAQPEFSIEKALQRDELSMAAAAYLNPRRRIAYFPGDA